MSEVLSTAMLKETLPLPPINPKTRINIKGKARLKTTVDGLRKMAFKLALVIASIAVIWLYSAFMNDFESANLSYTCQGIKKSLFILVEKKNNVAKFNAAMIGQPVPGNG